MIALCFGIFVSVLFSLQIAHAAQPIQLPKGEQITQLEWMENGKLLLLTTTPSGTALRIGDPDDGSVAVVRASKSFGLLPSASRFLISPAGNGVAVLQPSDSAIEPARLWLYRLEHGALTEVNLRKLGREFFPAQLCWQSDSGRLFVAAAEYMGAEHPDSVVAIDTATGAVSSAVKRESLDLIYELVYSARADSLLVKCGGYQGSYPTEPMVVKVKPGSTSLTLLHTQASEFTLTALPDSSVLLTAPRSAKERWVLLPGSDSLRRSEESLQLTAWTSTLDGTWLGGIADGRAIKRPGGQTYGVFRSRDGKLGFATSQPSRLVRFAADGKSVASVSADGATVSILPIPESQSE